MGTGDSSEASSDDERKRKRSHKDKKEKKEKHKKHDKHKDDKHKKHKKEHTAAIEPAGCAPCEISEDDYFTRTREFQQWLIDARSTFLDELSSDEARRLFKKFVSKWNTGALSQAIYDAKTSGPAASRTRHQWGFASKLSDTDQMQLDRTVDGVGSQTNLSKVGAAAAQLAPARAALPGASRGPSGPSRGPVGPSMAPPPPAQRPQTASGPPAPRTGGGGSSWDPEAFKRSMGM